MCLSVFYGPDEKKVHYFGMNDFFVLPVIFFVGNLCNPNSGKLVSVTGKFVNPFLLHSSCVWNCGKQCILNFSPHYLH